MSRSSRLLTLLALLMLAFMSMVIAITLLLAPPDAGAGACEPTGPSVRVDQGSLPTGPVAGYSQRQLVNAALIINAGVTLDVSVRGQTIAVMTAMGESSLLVLDRGDVAGPDSRGLFQQRANGSWGSYSDRMDPTISSTNFYKALLAVDGWEQLPPTIAAHRTQGNADPYHYEPFWDNAVAVVERLGNVRVSSAPGAGALPCSAAPPDSSGSVTPGGWAKPAVGPLTSPFGMRVHPVTGVSRMHTGDDIAAPCDAPIYAAHAGIVVSADAVSGYGNLITIDHGGGIATRYAHMYNDGLLTRAGAKVKAGQQIARIGANGLSSGCHLHFEVQQRGELIDPLPFMAARGISLG
jgi:murein DD-endopeptidase MepM/ murein hydrolase activator NlpD